MFKNLTKITDLTKGELLHIFEVSKSLESQFINLGSNSEYFKNQTLAMLFEKPSLRTRLAFQVASNQLGGQVIKLSSKEILIDLHGELREPISDIAKNLSSFVDLIFLRVFQQDTIEQFAQFATVPIINGLSDLHHPTQAIADLYTIWSLSDESFDDLKVVFIGDPCNVATSLLLGCEILGIEFVLASPSDYEIPSEILELSQGKFTHLHDPIEAVKYADFVYTDTWISMGLESEKEKRVKDFSSFQVDSQLMKKAKKTAKFMHCLPAHRGQEVSSEVIDGPQSIVLKQAHSKLVTAKALIKFLTK